MFEQTMQFGESVFTIRITDYYGAFEKDDGLLGQTNYDDLTIYIRDSLCDDAKRKTLIHEMVHALLYSSGRLYTNNFDREDVCELIASYLQSMMYHFNEVWNKYLLWRKEHNENQ